MCDSPYYCDEEFLSGGPPHQIPPPLPLSAGVRDRKILNLVTNLVKTYLKPGKGPNKNLVENLVKVFRAVSRLATLCFLLGAH